MQGFCRNGDSCNFIHENKSLQNRFGPVASAFPATERLDINPAAATHPRGAANSTRICIYFTRGSCKRSDTCQYVHPTPIVPPGHIHPEVSSLDPYRGQQDEGSLQAPSDSRGKVVCKFLSSPGGCRNGSCPYLHAVDSQESDNEDLKINEAEVNSYSSRLVSVLIPLIRIESMTTILLDIFQEHSSISTSWATFSKSPSRQTSLLRVLQALRQEPPLKQSLILFVA
jgi:hypothetical protein